MIKFLQKVPLYPFLISVYPFIYLLNENIREVTPAEVIRSCVILLLLSLLVFAFSLLLTRSASKSGLVTTLVILVFFLVFFVLYAPVYRALRDTSLFGEILGRHRYLMPATFLLLLITGLTGILTTRKMKSGILANVSFALNSVSMILILIPVVSVVIFTIRKAANLSKMQVDLPPIEQPLQITGKTSPDIYYIILDMHTSDNVLSKLSGYDDSAFTNVLEKEGFFVANCSRSNYAKTQHSLTSSLNMDYVQNLSGSIEVESIYPFMLSNLVVRSLQEAGYRIYAFDTGYAFTDLKDADVFYTPLSGAFDILFYPGLSPFESLIMQVSGGKILYEYRDQLSKKMQYIIDSGYVQYRDRIIYALDNLPLVASEPGPKFIFAHILAPHDPFVFDEAGNTVFRRTPFSLNGDPEGYDWDTFNVAYVSELKYLHERVSKIVEEIIASSNTPPVIIIQGDHGMPRARKYQAQFDIYNAYYFGGERETKLYDTISPVNSFRVVFNHYFNTTYPLLPDDSFSVDETNNIFTPVSTFFPCP